MLSRRLVLTAFSTALLALPVSAVLAELPKSYEGKPYDAAAFAADEKAGKHILLHIQASWCPTCAAQRPILSQLKKLPELQDLVVYNIDFDTDKALLRTLKVQTQSTLILYRGETEVGRSTGETKPEAIRALLLKSKPA